MRKEYFDSIEDEIQIKANSAKVWEWVSTPGWWINDGQIGAHQTIELGDQLLVQDPKYGEFLIKILESTPAKSVVYRWYAIRISLTPKLLRRKSDFSSKKMLKAAASR